MKGKAAPSALVQAKIAESLNPGFYQNSALRGRALLALGQRTEAAAAFRAAIGASPAFLAERRELEALLREAEEGSQ